MEFDSVITPSIRRRTFTGAVAGLLVLAAACGSDDDEPSTAETTSGGASQTTAATGGATTTSAGGTDTTMAMGETTMAPDESMADTTEGGETTEGGGSTPAGGSMMEMAEGDVFVTGSSTVEPISIRVGELASEMSGGGLAVTVEGPGTGDGFVTFCAGGADITDASRPISDEEIALCEEDGVEYIELEVAIDGLTVATNPANEAITCLDVPALYALIGPESEGTATWAENAALATELQSAYADDFPELPLDISGPGEESGTYDSFLEFAIADLAEERTQDEATRADYSSSPNDNLIVEGLTASESSLGWVGYAFYVGQQDALKAIEIDDGEGCVAPTEETIADGSYPFSRSLYIYVNAANAESNPAVASYVDLYLSPEGLAAVSEAGYVELPEDRLTATQQAWTDR